jgi:formylglycine-generating enzyme required for sulfatase activity
VQNLSKYVFIFLFFINSNFSFSQTGKYYEEIIIPAGRFIMGSNDNQCQCYDFPAHEVFLDSFYIDKYEVTNAQFKLFIDDNGYCDSSYWTPIGWRFIVKNEILEPRFWNDENFGINQPNKPVVGISWYEAYAYAKWAKKRLPTEAEWEKSTGADGRRLYPWGNEKPDITRCNFGYFFGNTLNSSTKDAGSYELGKSKYGLYDMSGNVSEWCNDWHHKDYYSKSPKENPQGPQSGTYKCLRGGSWFLYVRFMRISARDFAEPEIRKNYIGFRCARTP